MRVNVVLRWFVGGTAVCAATAAALVAPSLATQGLAPSSNALVVPPVVAQTTVQARVRPAQPTPPKPAQPAPRRPLPVAVTPPRPAATPRPVAARPPRPKSPVTREELDTPAPRILLSTRDEPPKYSKPQRGKVVDVDDEEDEEDVAESRHRDKHEDKDKDDDEGEGEKKGGRKGGHD